MSTRITPVNPAEAQPKAKEKGTGNVSLTKFLMLLADLSHLFRNQPWLPQ
jgi:hypothetical protein